MQISRQCLCLHVTILCVLLSVIFTHHVTGSHSHNVEEYPDYSHHETSPQPAGSGKHEPLATWNKTGSRWRRSPEELSQQLIADDGELMSGMIYDKMESNKATYDDMDGDKIKYGEFNVEEETPDVVNDDIDSDNCSRDISCVDDDICCDNTSSRGPHTANTHYSDLVGYEFQCLSTFMS